MHYHIIKVIVIASLLLMQIGCNKPSEPKDNPPEKDTIPNYDEGCTSGIKNPSVKGKILFTSRRSGEYQQLFMMGPDGANIKQLTFGEYNNLMGRWSKDGKKIAFQSDTPKTTLGIPVYIMNSDGDNKYPLLPNYYYNQFPLVGSPEDWTSDSKAILVGTCKPCDPYPDFFSLLVSINGQIVKNLRDKINKLSVSGYPFYSPDFSKIALSSIDYIYILDSNFTNLKKIKVSAGAGGIAWSPDGCKIVFGAKAETNTWGELFVYYLDRNEKEQITYHAGNEQFRYPRWSPDSKKIIFYSQAIPSLENGFSHNTYIKIVDIGTKQITTVIDDSTAIYPDWSWSEINE